MCGWSPDSGRGLARPRPLTSRRVPDSVHHSLLKQPRTQRWSIETCSAVQRHQSWCRERCPSGNQQRDLQHGRRGSLALAWRCAGRLVQRQGTCFPGTQTRPEGTRVAARHRRKWGTDRLRSSGHWGLACALLDPGLDLLTSPGAESKLGRSGRIRVVGPNGSRGLVCLGALGALPGYRACGSGVAGRVSNSNARGTAGSPDLATPSG